MDIGSLKIPKLRYMQMQSKDGIRKEGYLEMCSESALLDSRELIRFTSGKFLA